VTVDRAEITTSFAITSEILKKCMNILKFSQAPINTSEGIGLRLAILGFLLQHTRNCSLRAATVHIIIFSLLKITPKFILELSRRYRNFTTNLSSRRHPLDYSVGRHSGIYLNLKSETSCRMCVPTVGDVEFISDWAMQICHAYLTTDVT
jgi:hypothetical protein